MSDAEIKGIRNIGGKNPLIIYSDCFNSNIKNPTSGRSSNARETQGQRVASKTSKLQVAAQRSKKKDRK